MILTCPLEGSPLMTREYVNYWPTQRMNTSQGNLRIMLKKREQDSSSTSSKEVSNKPKEKSHLSSKSQAKSNDTLQVSKTSSKSKTLKDRDMSGKSKLRRVMSSSKTTSLASKGCHGSSTTNELHVSLDNGNSQRSNLEIPCDDISLMYDSLNGFEQLNVSSSPMDHHWNRPKKRHKS